MNLSWKTLHDHPKETSDFQPLAVEIVGKCGGLPTAIKTIANALTNESLFVWKDALNQLRNPNPRCIPGMEANVYSTITMSYNFLESLGWFVNVYKLEEGRNRVHALIDNLKTSCLLLDGDTEYDVKIHDNIHAVAVSIAADEHMFNVQILDDLKEKLENVEFPSLCELGISGCPELKRFISSSTCAEELGSEENIHTNMQPLFDEKVALPSLEVFEHLGLLFPKLCMLKLKDLLKLKRFCNITGNIIQLHYLSDLWMENCPNTETFTCNSISVHMTANEESQEVTSKNSPADIQPLFCEKLQTVI
ncbi:NB-ARC domain-containing disease resistance protein [Melia azedarach]|uniref:NB-ARC domain-containing disease resistance protein n=1 Tax=Melia azedarach TaxID=155640 RepID=A0ACC1X8D4_MELAZ|nr:NB-ARC domain-containing disease resistance protein [Melia azedarach]